MSRKLTTEEFISKAKSIHGNRYGYSSVKYKSSHVKVIVSCKKHDNFEISPANHLQGYGCRLCVNEKMSKRHRKSIDVFITEANIKHNNMYDYSSVIYKNSYEKIKIICSQHGAFFQIPSSHLHGGAGCPQCSLRISKQEKQWLDYIKVPDNDKHRQVRLLMHDNSYIVADGYDSKINTVYEYHGDFWHGNPDKYDLTDINERTNKTFGELFAVTKYRENIIRKSGYNLIVIWENDWKKQRDSYQSHLQSYKS